MVQKNSNQKAGATSHQPHSRDIAIATINVTINDCVRVRVRMTAYTAGFGKGGVEFYINRIIKLSNHY